MSRNLGVETASIFVSYTFPVYQAQQSNGSINTVALSTVGLGLIFYLANLFGENTKGRSQRSIQEDQLELFRQIEDNIATMGVDGHACVLRFICEMQTNRFSRSSIFGEIFTLIFTPKQGDDYSLLKDYIAAEMAGQEADTPSGSAGPICVERYPSCPMSVFAALRRFQSGLGYSTPADRPGNATIHMDDHTLTLDDEV
ncbi:uncharacterized protein [Panulirus ornatus]|uniref:uncharacterized protein isoform X2 n=1 Tax=Panulirus ornatus TaxID=150431 RepID=UPI003A87B067